MNRSIHRKSMLAALAAGAVMVTGAAWADTAEEIIVTGERIGQSTKVSWSELDIEKRAGAAVLYRRLGKAADEVCGLPLAMKTRSIAELSVAFHCSETALDVAVAQVDSEMLSSIHNGN